MTTYAGTREMALKAHAAGHTLSYHVWTYYSNSWQCEGGCCSDDCIEDSEEMIEVIAIHCDGNFEKVVIHPKETDSAERRVRR